MKPLSTAMALGMLAILLGACSARPDGVRPVVSLVDDEGAAATVADLSLPMERGKAYFSAGRYGLALNAFREALAEEPSSARALNAIAATFDQLGRFDLADRYYGLALRLDPRSIEVLNNLGYSHLLRGDLAEAQKYLAQASLIDQGQPVVQANLRLAERGGAASDHVAAPTAAEGSKRAPPQAPAAVALQPEDDPAVRLLRVARGVKALVTAPEPTELAMANGTMTRPAPQVASARPRPAPEPSGRGPILVAYRPAADGVGDGPWAIEVSNGTGREAMAARMREYLASVGIDVDHLTNDASYRNTTSRIFCRPEAKAVAVALGATLPIAVEVETREDQRSDVRLLLGADLLEFDAGLINNTL